MDEQEKELSELNIEDILKEFGDFDIQEESSEENFLADFGTYEDSVKPQEEDVKLWDEDTEENSEVQQVPQDTVRLDDITKVIKEQAAVTEETIAFTPVGGDFYDDDVPVFVPPTEPETEPYSEEWEPEYEQPIGEYVPPEPIVFRPKSRLRELKKQLIAGPEKRYYELTELGLGKLQLAILGCGLVAVVSAVTTAMYAMGAVPQERMRLMVFGQLLGLLLSALLGSYQLMEGFSDLVKRQFSLNTLLLFSLIGCVADGILCLHQVRVPCCAPFSLNVTMSLWSAYQRRNTELGQMDTMRKAIRLNSVVVENDFYQGMPGILRGEGQVEDFMSKYHSASPAERTLNVYALTALFVSLGIGIIAGALLGMVNGIRFFSACLLVAVPAAAYISISRPMAILERKLHNLGTVLCGWQGVMALSTKAAFPLYGEDLFPAGSVKLNGLKFYGSRNPDQVIAYGAAVMMADGGGLAPLFSQLLESRNGYHYEVETLRTYPNGGVGGIVNDEAVLVGTLEFIQEMGVEMPAVTRVSQAVYVAVDGVLNGVFAITYNRIKASVSGLTSLCAYRGLFPVMAAGDFMLSPEFIAGKFGAGTRRILFPDRKKQDELAARLPDEETEASALTTQEGLAGIAYAVTGSRVLRTVSVMGVAVQMLGGILGLLIMLALAVVHAEHLLTPENLLLYELVWMIPGILLTEWTRYV